MRASAGRADRPAGALRRADRRPCTPPEFAPSWRSGRAGADRLMGRSLEGRAHLAVRLDRTAKHGVAALWHEALGELVGGGRLARSRAPVGPATRRTKIPRAGRAAQDDAAAQRRELRQALPAAAERVRGPSAPPSNPTTDVPRPLSTSPDRGRRPPAPAPGARPLHRRAAPEVVGRAWPPPSPTSRSRCRASPVPRSRRRASRSLPPPCPPTCSRRCVPAGRLSAAQVSSCGLRGLAPERDGPRARLPPRLRRGLAVRRGAGRLVACVRGPRRRRPGYVRAAVYRWRRPRSRPGHLRRRAAGAPPC